MRPAAQSSRRGLPRPRFGQTQQQDLKRIALKFVRSRRVIRELARLFRGFIRCAVCRRMSATTRCVGVPDRTFSRVMAATLLRTDAGIDDGS